MPLKVAHFCVGSSNTFTAVTMGLGLGVSAVGGGADPPSPGPISSCECEWDHLTRKKHNVPNLTHNMRNTQKTLKRRRQLRYKDKTLMVFRCATLMVFRCAVAHTGTEVPMDRGQRSVAHKESGGVRRVVEGREGCTLGFSHTVSFVTVLW